MAKPQAQLPKVARQHFLCRAKRRIQFTSIVLLAHRLLMATDSQNFRIKFMKSAI